MVLAYNKAYNNGINGLVVHKTDRANVTGNSLWDNGQVSTSPPDSRQPYAGLTLNNAVDVEVRDNIVKTERNDDYAYVVVSGSVITGNSGNNKVWGDIFKKVFKVSSNASFRTARLRLRLGLALVSYSLGSSPLFLPLHGLNAKTPNSFNFVINFKFYPPSMK